MLKVNYMGEVSIEDSILSSISHASDGKFYTAILHDRFDELAFVVLFGAPYQDFYTIDSNLVYTICKYVRCRGLNFYKNAAKCMADRGYELKYVPLLNEVVDNYSNYGSVDSPYYYAPLRSVIDMITKDVDSRKDIFDHAADFRFSVRSERYSEFPKSEHNNARSNDFRSSYGFCGGDSIMFDDVFTIIRSDSTALSALHSNLSFIKTVRVIGGYGDISIAVEICDIIRKNKLSVEVVDATSAGCLYWALKDADITHCIAVDIHCLDGTFLASESINGTIDYFRRLSANPRFEGAFEKNRFDKIMQGFSKLRTIIDGKSVYDGRATEVWVRI